MIPTYRHRLQRRCESENVYSTIENVFVTVHCNLFNFRYFNLQLNDQSYFKGIETDIYE